MVQMQTFRIDRPRGARYNAANTQYLVNQHNARQAVLANQKNEPSAVQARFQGVNAATGQNIIRPAAGAQTTSTSPPVSGSSSSTARGGSLLDQWQAAYDEARKSNLDRYDQILGGYDDRYGQVTSLADQQNSALQQGFADRHQNVMGMAGNQMQEILGGYRNRYDTGMGMLEGMGAQHTKDIDRNYDAHGGRIQHDMVNRGLSASTVSPAMQTMNERERMDSHGRHQEQLRGQQLGYHSALSGDLLGAAQNMGNNRMMLEAGLSGDSLQAQMGMNQNRLGLEAGLTGDKLNFMERREDTYPDLGQMMALAQAHGASGYNQQFGQQMQPQGPSGAMQAYQQAMGWPQQMFQNAQMGANQWNQQVQQQQWQRQMQQMQQQNPQGGMQQGPPQQQQQPQQAQQNFDYMEYYKRQHGIPAHWQWNGQTWVDPMQQMQNFGSGSIA